MERTISELTNCFKDLFKQITLNPNSIDSNIIYGLLEAVNTTNDPDLYTNPYIINTLYLLKKYSLTNILIDIEIELFELKESKYLIQNFNNHFEKIEETYIVEQDNWFITEKNTGRKKLANASVLTTGLPSRGSYTKIRRSTSPNAPVIHEYTIDFEGYVICEEDIHEDMQIDLDTIDINEVYSDDILNYQDDVTEEQLLEEEGNLNENNIK